MDIKNLKELVSAVAKSVKAGLSIAADGKIALDDLGAIIALAPVVGPAIEGIDQLPAEIKDMNQEELAELLAHISSELVVDNPKAQLIIEKSLALLPKLASVYASGKELVAAIKA